MTDVRWVDVQDYLDSARKHFANATQLYDEGGFEAEDFSAYRAQMAILHAMQSGHTSLEGALKRILEILGEELPTGDQSHADLITRVCKEITVTGYSRPAVLSRAIGADVNETRKFRHRATHGYDSFDPELAKPAIDAARRLARELEPAIRQFQEIVDP